MVEDDIALLKQYQKEIILLSQSVALLHWDLECYMPKEGSESRAEQIALLSRLVHEKMISEELSSVLERLRKRDLQGDDGVMVERVYHDVMKSKKLPPEFVEELSRVTSLASTAWEKAREENDFKLFEPHLKKIVKLKRKEAGYIGLPGHPYNSLLDTYEEGMTVEELKPKLENIKKWILELLSKIKDSESYKNQELAFLKQEFPRQAQIDLNIDVIKRMGLENKFSRLDLSVHPFTTRISQGDVRFTTAIRQDPLFSFLSTIHEAGHGLYEAGLPKENKFTFLDEIPSLGINESQSRFWEIMVAHGKPFWKFYLDRFKEKIEIDNFNQWYKEVNFVKPSLIRIESDEIHYPLHIILRFEIEMGLIDGTIHVEDLPSIWNKKVEELIGITPENNREGVLQDVHWSQGCIGYFPTYTLGSIYAVQIYKALKRRFPEIEEDIEKGDFNKIIFWLRENIHKIGRKKLTKEIIRDVCGEDLNPEEYLLYLNKKYSEIYNLT